MSMWYPGNLLQMSKELNVSSTLTFQIISKTMCIESEGQAGLVPEAQPSPFSRRVTRKVRESCVNSLPMLSSQSRQNLTTWHAAIAASAGVVHATVEVGSAAVAAAVAGVAFRRLEASISREEVLGYCSEYVLFACRLGKRALKIICE